MARFLTLFFALFALFASCGTACAELQLSLVVSDLEGTQNPESIPAGMQLQARVEARNVSTEPVNLLRFVVQSSPYLVLADENPGQPGSGGIRVLSFTQEKAEGLIIPAGETETWSFDLKAPAFLPGGAELSLGVKAYVAAQAEALTADFSASSPGYELLETATRKTLRNGDGFEVTLIALMPPGEYADLRINAQIPGFVSNLQMQEVFISDPAACEGPVGHNQNDQKVEWALGLCRIDPLGGSVKFEVSVRGRITDVTVPEDLPLRKGKLIWSIRAAGERLQTIERPLQVHGPLLVIEPVEDAVPEFAAGDAISVPFRVENAGDEAVKELRFWAAPMVQADCLTMRMSLTGHNLLKLEGAHDDAKSSCGQFVQPPEYLVLPPGRSLELTYQFSVRRDADLTAGMRLVPRMSARLFQGEDVTQIVAVPAMLTLMPPAPPVLSVRKGWEGVVDLYYASSIGQRAEGELLLTMPEGIRQARINILSQVVQAQTGAPVAAGGVAISALRLAPGGTSRRVRITDMGTQTSRGWRIHGYHIEMSTAPAHASDVPLKFLLDMRTENGPALREGRDVQLHSELIIGERRIEGENILETLVQEPLLRLSVDTPGQRLLEPGKRSEVIATLCNKGSAAAHDMTLTFAHSGALQAIGELSRSLKRLDPNTCQSFSSFMRARRALQGGAAFEDEAGVSVSVSDYASLPQGEGRTYTGPKAVEMSFSIPGLVTQTSTALEAAAGQKLQHRIDFQMPKDALRSRVELVLESSAGLYWRAFLVGQDGQERPWTDQPLSPGVPYRLFLRAVLPAASEAGWSDTLVASLTMASPDGSKKTDKMRLVSRLADELVPLGIITRRLLAVDRDCDGSLLDETAQDALFARSKEARADECIVFRISFKNAGQSKLHRVEIDDLVPKGMRFVEGSDKILTLPDSLKPLDASMRGSRWRFDGILRPGGQGEVRYSAQILP